MGNDIIVVGGGIIGSCIVDALLSSGLNNVVCVESDPAPIDSASLASGAMLGALGEVTASRNRAGDTVETAFRIACTRQYESWLDGLVYDGSCRPSVGYGTFVVANSAGKDDDRNITAIAHAAQTENEPFDWVDPGTVTGLSAHRSVAPRQVLFLPREGFIDSSAVMAALRAANERRRPGVYVSGTVVDFSFQAGRMAGVICDNKRTLAAPEVVLCCGRGIGALLNTGVIKDLRLPAIVGGKGSSILLRSDIDFPYVIRTPNRDFACGTHVVPRGIGRLYVGATNRISATPGADWGVTAGEAHAQLHSAIHEINTGLRTASIEHLRFGARPLSVDGFPLVGRTDLDGLSIATGTYRNGMLMAPMIGRIVAAEVLRQSGPRNPFSPGGRDALLGPRHDLDVITEGVRDLVSFVQEPHGLLPYNRARELGDLITVLLETVLDEHSESAQHLRAALAEFREHPLPEFVPSLLYTAHELKSSQRRSARADVEADK